MTAVCSDCFEDEYLKQKVMEEGEEEECSCCGLDAHPAIGIETLGEWLEPILREHFQLGDEYKHYGRDDDHGEWRQEGDYLGGVVQEVLGQYFDFEDEIVDAVIQAEDAWPQDGDYGIWDATSSYVPTKVRIGHLVHEWDEAAFQIRHTSRFFSTAAKALFDKVFNDIDHLRASVGREYHPVVFDMPAETRIFRARVGAGESFLKDAYHDPYKHIGPPPRDKARAGRMNAEGIVVFYGAMDVETCLSELRPAIGSDSMVMEVQTSRALRVLDFSRLEKAIGARPLSYFEPGFSEKVEIRKFLRQLHYRIARPVIPGRESEYLITQTMAEYLAYVMPHPVDGVMFSSAQKEGGTNIVLFPERNANLPEFSINYVPDSLRLFRTSAIEYSHNELNVYQGDDGIPWIGSYDDGIDEEWDD